MIPHGIKWKNIHNIKCESTHFYVPEYLCNSVLLFYAEQITAQYLCS